MKKIAVIGAGIIGLTSAICLQEAGFAVTIYTRELPQNTTSTAAGAVWWGYGEGKVREWARRSLEIFRQDIASDIQGIQSIRLRDVYRHQAEHPWFHADVAHCEPIPENDLRAPYISGFLLDIPLVNPPVYLDYLHTKFMATGGEIIQKACQSLSELSDDYPIIVNCTGVGARELVNDADVYPIRGQTAIVSAPDVSEGFMDDEHFTYIFPRTDGVVLGGILQPHQDDLEVDIVVRQDILMRCVQVDERLKDSAIIRETVGLRPGRYAVRLEAEQLSDGCLVIHNYGHAGIGFTLSWGCADNVVRLASG